MTSSLGLSPSRFAIIAHHPIENWQCAKLGRVLIIDHDERHRTNAGRCRGERDRLQQLLIVRHRRRTRERDRVLRLQMVEQVARGSAKKLQRTLREEPRRDDVAKDALRHKGRLGRLRSGICPSCPMAGYQSPNRYPAGLMAILPSRRCHARD